MKRCKAIICLGIDNRKIHEAFNNVVDLIVETQGAEEAVKVAYKIAAKGDNVLLSPACASFDLFENYEDRGRQFKSSRKATISDKNFKKYKRRSYHLGNRCAVGHIFLSPGLQCKYEFGLCGRERYHVRAFCLNMRFYY